MPAGARTHHLINTSKPMSFTITTDRANTPRARTLLDIFRPQAQPAEPLAAIPLMCKCVAEPAGRRRTTHG